MKREFFAGCLLIALQGCGQQGPETKSAEPLLPSRPSALSEGWVSSGGELLRDARNPWWVKNTSEVSYCIDIDTRSISVDETYVDRVFKDVLENWKRDFRRVVDAVRKHGGVATYDGGGVGTQSFSKTSCDANPDLRIVLGYDALTFQERRYISDPARIAAYAVRTSYDPVNLKGKGFIFLGSESGPFRFQQKAYKRPWAVDFNLGATLFHEMGHVFGIGHLEHDRGHSMREGAVEALFEGEHREEKYIASFNGATFMNVLSLNWGFMVGSIGTKYEHGSNFSKFFMTSFENDSAYNLHAWKMADQDESFYKKMKFFDPNWERDGKPITLDIAEIDEIKMHLRRTPAITMYLTSEQSVFPDLDYKKTGFVRKRVLDYLDAVGSGTAHCGKDQKTKKPIFFELDGQFSFKFFGEVEGQIQELFPTKKPREDDE